MHLESVTSTHKRSHVIVAKETKVEITTESMLLQRLEGGSAKRGGGVCVYVM